MPDSPNSVAPQQSRPSLQIQAVSGMHSHPSAPGQGLEPVEQLLRQAPILPGSDEKIPQQTNPALQAPSTPVVQAQPSALQVQAYWQVPSPPIAPRAQHVSPSSQVLITLPMQWHPS